AAERMLGVLLVMTHENVPAQAPFQPKGEDRHARPKPVLADAEVKHFGQPVALVVAETPEIARAAAEQVRVTYEKRNGDFAIDAASGKSYDPGKTNTGQPANSALGDFDQAFQAAPVHVDMIYRTPYQSHAMMEPHASVARWQDGKLTIICSAQLVEAGRHSIASTLQLAPDKVELISEYVGGGFCGKLPVYADAIFAAPPSRAPTPPVRVVLARQQVFPTPTHRAASTQRVRRGAERDGPLPAIAPQSLSQSARADEFVEPIANSTRSLYAADNRLTSLRIATL